MFTFLDVTRRLLSHSRIRYELSSYLRAMNLVNGCFIPFETSTEQHALHEKFTFPFYYNPHPVAVQAANQLQVYLETQTDWAHNFEIDQQMEGLEIGKMFGMLVQHGFSFAATTSQQKWDFIAIFERRNSN